MAARVKTAKKYKKSDFSPHGGIIDIGGWDQENEVGTGLLEHRGKHLDRGGRYGPRWWSGTVPCSLCKGDTVTAKRAKGQDWDDETLKIATKANLSGVDRDKFDAKRRALKKARDKAQASHHFDSVTQLIKHLAKHHHIAVITGGNGDNVKASAKLVKYHPEVATCLDCITNEAHWTINTYEIQGSELVAVPVGG